jgi:hypothetical protein
VRAAILLACLSAAASARAEPVEVQVGVYLMSVGKVDIASGSYTVDFYLTLSSDKDMGDPRIEFLNGRASFTDLLIDKPTEKQYRIQANLMTNLDLKRYPWDRHELPIILESATRKDDDLVFIKSKYEGIDPAVVFVGWELLGFRSSIAPHPYPLFSESYSVYRFAIDIQRVLFISSLKTFLPIAVFLLISFCALIVAVEKSDSRISMNTAMLIASVMFHLSITNQLPPTGYLTIADKAMIATYMTIALSLFLSVLMMRHVQAQRLDEARKLREAAFKIVPGFAFAAYAFAALMSW